MYLNMQAFIYYGSCSTYLCVTVGMLRKAFELKAEKPKEFFEKFIDKKLKGCFEQYLKRLDN